MANKLDTKSHPRSHLLLRRVEEETLSIVPPLNARGGQPSFCEVKVVRKFYEGEIPTTTDGSRAVSDMIDQFVTTRSKSTGSEELLGELPEHLDDLYYECSDDASKSTQRASDESKQFGSFSSSRKSREDEKPSQRSTKTTTGKTKVNKAINKTPYSYEIVSEEQPQPSSCNEIEQLQKEVAELKKQLESKQLQNYSAVASGSCFVSSTLNSPQKTIENDNSIMSSIHVGSSDDEIDVTELSDDSDVGIQAPTLPSVSMPQEISREITIQEAQNEARNKRVVPKEMNIWQKLNDVKDRFKPMSRQVELVDGYGVYLSLCQLDEANMRGGNSPTKLLRCLLVALFEPSVLATSSCLGNGKHPALDPAILNACFKYVQMRHPQVTRSVLVDCVNDKCASFRRKFQL